MQEVRIEVYERFERTAELAEARRHGWFWGVVVEFAGGDGDEPAEVEGAPIAAGKFSAHRDERGKEAGAFEVVGVVAAFVVGGEGQDDVAVFFANGESVVVMVGAGDGGIEESGGEAQHEGA